MDPSNPKIQKAIKSLKAIKSDRVKALVAQGELYYQDNDLTNAIMSYQKAREADTRNPKLKKRLKQLMAKQTDEIASAYSEAEKLYAQG